MEIVLLENIKNLGKIGDVVIVKRGHGRNFLIKFGKAIKASKENIIEINFLLFLLQLQYEFLLKFQRVN